RKVGMFLPVLVAPQAAIADVLGRSVFEGEYFRLIATAFNVGLARTVAGFAAVPLGTFFRIQHGHVVRGIFVGLVEALAGHVFVAGLAGFRANVIGGNCRRDRRRLFLPVSEIGDET